MKIGDVAQQYGISVDTLRFYVKEGLLIPEGQERYSRYSFQKRDLEDLELILRMKEQQFSLQEIHAMLALRRTSNMVEPHTISQFKELYAQKKTELRAKISQLTYALESIEREEGRLSEAAPKARTATGVPLRSLSLLACPCCCGRFKLENADLDVRYIYRGTLRCDCGKTLPINDGIIETGNLYTGSYDSPDLKRELYTEVIGKFLSMLHKGLDEVQRFLQREARSGNVLMETHINSFFFAYNHLNALPQDCVYIVVDRYPEMLREYKRLLESLGEERDFLFIADNSFHFPIKANCVDLLVDCMSDNEFSLYDPGSYIEKMNPYLKDTAKVVGTLLSFDGVTRSQQLIHEKYPEGNELPHSRARTEKQYKEAGFSLHLISEGTVVETAHKDRFAWSCHVPGDIMQISFMLARRK